MMRSRFLDIKYKINISNKYSAVYCDALSYVTVHSLNFVVNYLDVEMSLDI